MKDTYLKGRLGNASQYVKELANKDLTARASRQVWKTRAYRSLIYNSLNKHTPAATSEGGVSTH